METLHQQLRMTLPAGYIKSAGYKPPKCLPSTVLLLYLFPAGVFDLMTKARTTSSSLDLLPTTLLKACLPTLCPGVLTIIN